MDYGYRKKLDVTFGEAVEKTKSALLREGFGILTEIDVKATLKSKLDIDLDRYVILGACNPPFAHKALLAEKEIGLMLPCNVIVYENENNVFVSAVMPSVAMGMIRNEKLKSIAGDVEDKLRRAVDSI